ncbi:hypothetical protein R1T43_10280 [Alteromonas sp. CI.11.F.A3]|nr:hypothetical protein [Alteromonas sp. CI.11.F.A3]WOI35622.1 hypothetical protein R1T43_10280 [Alteromonas sp. CI.11.F.A3]
MTMYPVADNPIEHMGFAQLLAYVFIENTQHTININHHEIIEI